MCDYGYGESPSPDEIRRIITDTIEDWPHRIKRMLIGTCGSIFDQEEINGRQIDALLEVLSRSSIPSFIWETHYSTVNEAVLDEVMESLPDREHYVEMGFESSNEYVLRECLHKYMNLADLSECLNELRTRAFHPILNVFVGSPGLTSDEQIEDAVRSVHWAFDHGAEEVVLFPANIKQGTKLYELYRKGQYHRTLHKQLLDVLSELDDNELGHTSVSWYGDRQDEGVEVSTIPPDDKGFEHDRLMRFYDSFMFKSSPIQRRQEIEEILREYEEK